MPNAHETLTKHRSEPDRVYDVAVIGAGIVGSAIARELSGFRLSVALLEARADVGDVTSKANTALLHTGFDATPGTLESRLVTRGHELLRAYAKQTGIPVERTGAMLVAWTSEELEALPGLQAKAELNGYGESRIVTAEAVYRDLPHLGPGALGALDVPDESIICTWTATLALATEARLRDVDLLLDHHVDRVEVGAQETVLHTGAATIRARCVINAAGLGSDTVDRLFGHRRFAVTPRRGELIVFDKLARPLVNRIVLAVPGKLGKGVLISPTIYGNVMLGPTAEDLEDKAATGTSRDGLAFLLRKGQALMPSLLSEEVTATYAGLRATIDRSDYLIEFEPTQRYVLVAGIRSTGLTSAMAIAEHVRDQLDAGDVLALIARDDLPGPPRMPNLGESFPRPYQQADLITADPAYGRIVCFCERVSAGEVRDAFASPIPPRDLNGLRRRTRATGGRCQGFYCAGEIQALIDADGHAAPSPIKAATAR
jgi:glycerol-3-phosphate dehydrogenase